MSGVCNNDSEKGEAAGGDSMESATAVSQSLRESSGAKYKPGFICLLSSQAGSIGLIGYTAYSASKFALRGLAEALQMELRPHNVFVTLTHPPDTETPSLKKENEERSELLKLVFFSSFNIRVVPPGNRRGEEGLGKSKKKVVSSLLTVYLSKLFMKFENI